MPNPQLSLDLTELKLFQNIPDDFKLPIILPSIFLLAVKESAKLTPALTSQRYEQTS
jgi:hypothetical protein